MECEDTPPSMNEVSYDIKLPREGRVKWTQDQDHYLTNLAVIYHAKGWNTIASCMNDKFPTSKKTSKQCRERWHYCLDLKINHKPWSKQEEAKLLLGHMDYGNKWCDITTRFKGRHNNMIKNRFYSILRKVKNKVRNNDYSSQDQLELIEMHYMSTVMIDYIKNPAPKEDLKRKRGRDFMYTLVNDITIKALESYKRELETYNPLQDSLRSLLERTVDVGRSQEKGKGSPALTSCCLKQPLDAHTSSYDCPMTIGRILKFCWGDKSESFTLPEPPSFVCKVPFDLDEKKIVTKELFPRKEE